MSNGIAIFFLAEGMEMADFRFEECDREDERNRGIPREIIGIKTISSVVQCSSCNEKVLT